jgi:hypothetical protein
MQQKKQKEFASNEGASPRISIQTCIGRLDRLNETGMNLSVKMFPPVTIMSGAIRNVAPLRQQ